MNKYWQNFGGGDDPENLQKKADEFREELPFEDFDGKELVDAKAPRRDFLKYLGFSTAAAALAAGCKIPERKAVPFANKPENIIPGEAKFYATTYVQDGDVVPVLAKVRDGRPIKLEGNDLSVFTNGGTTARAQASVLDLYDTHRNRFPSQKVGTEYPEIPTFESVDKTIMEALGGLAGKQIVFLSSTIVSPSTKDIIAKFPNLKHVQYDAVSYSGMLQANEASGFGRKLPSYNFDAAKVMVSLGADFLGTWLSPLEYAVGYTKGRKINEKNPEMSKHYQFESHLSTTGANADERFTHRPSETGVVALALLNAIDGSVAAPAINDAKLRAGIAKVANDLKANNGKALVVCGSNDMNVQVVVNAINNAIGANGATIDWSKPVNYRQGIDKDFETLVTDMDAGNVGALLIYGANPAYTYYNADNFKKALAKVKLSVSFNERWDETTQLCSYNLPTHHYLESWGDAEPKAGITSFIQPTIYPLFKTRAYQTSLLKWSGNNTTYEDYFKNFWNTKLGSDDAFNKVLQEGILVATAEATAAGAGAYGGAALGAASAALVAAKKVNGDEIVLYEKVSIGSGVGSTNPWLQEMPDAISKACWDNYAMISMSKAKELLDLDLYYNHESEVGAQARDYKYYPQKPVIKVTAGNREIILPVLVIPGMNSNTIAVAVGYGRSDKMGKTATGVGVNAYPLASFNGTTVNYSNEVKLTDEKRKVKLAQMQIQNTYDGRVEVVRETTLATFKKNPNAIPEYRQEMTDDFAKSTGDFRAEATIYPDHLKTVPLKWGMTIDMNACFGCGACVVACHAENNVPVVGKGEVLRYHDMHWLRIDRYFVSDPNNVDDLKGVVFQPMLCQHCDNAPCENVCPVSATNHSTEGINQMAYNRCIGTRYCANNCPYKVRRFNWGDFTGADSFPNNQDQWLVGKLDPVVHQMNEDLTRMVLNPDVTVRSRGVMEKCTFCIQRTQAAKLKAKKENRMLADGDAKTACQQACAGDAIVFGNVRDQTSQVSRIREENKQRSFYVIEHLHVLPNITYLEKIRNTDEIIETGEHHEEAGTKISTGEPEKAEH
ncbi:MAG TPA: Fe-S cluster-containing hydrogenase [Chitinophagaceae bacterium]|nr:Fe-S cluster-containing hydrogenase [Chitinophagaceae bacterium]